MPDTNLPQLQKQLFENLTDEQLDTLRDSLWGMFLEFAQSHSEDELQKSKDSLKLWDIVTDEQVSRKKIEK